MIVGIAMLLVSITLMIIGIIAELNDRGFSSTAIGFVAGGFCAVALAIIITSCDKEPTAMDVYKGKTTLQYTIVDGESIDSVVVWKPIKEE